MYIGRGEYLTYSAEDYIFANMYSYDSKRLHKWQLKSLLDYYFEEVDDSIEYLDIDVFTDWIHELTDSDIAQIVKSSNW